MTSLIKAAACGGGGWTVGRKPFFCECTADSLPITVLLVFIAVYSPTASSSQRRMATTCSQRRRHVDAICATTLILLVLVPVGRIIDAASRDGTPSSLNSALHHTNAPLFLQLLARDGFFHFVEPGFSPFICSRRTQHLNHPLVLRLTDEAVTKLRFMRATIIRIDAAILHAPDADTGDCPARPDPQSVANISWCAIVSPPAAF